MRPDRVVFLNAYGLRFDGTTKGLVSSASSAFLDANGFVAFFVAQVPAGGTWRSLLATYNAQPFGLYAAASGTPYRFFNGVHAPTSLQGTAAQVLGYVATPGGSFVDRRDGTGVSTTGISSTILPASAFAIGNYVTVAQTGTASAMIGEVVVLEKSFALADWEKIEGYLAHKWGLAGSLPVGHPYKSAPP